MRRPRLTYANVAATTALVLAGTGVSWAVIPDNGVVHGCYRLAVGSGGPPADLILRDSGDACPAGYNAIDWNQTGPPGPQGAAGPAATPAPTAEPTPAPTPAAPPVDTWIAKVNNLGQLLNGSTPLIKAGFAPGGAKGYKVSGPKPFFACGLQATVDPPPKVFEARKKGLAIETKKDKPIFATQAYAKWNKDYGGYVQVQPKALVTTTVKNEFGQESTISTMVDWPSGFTLVITC